MWNPVQTDDDAFSRDLMRNLVQARRKAHLTQDHIAVALNIGRSGVGMLEQGRARMTAIQLHRYCQCIGYNVIDLWPRLECKKEKAA